MSFTFTSNGAKGPDASHGLPGADGCSGSVLVFKHGENGHRGGDAGPAFAGMPATGVVVWLSSGLDASDPQNSIVRVQGACAAGKVDETIAAESLDQVHCEAIGGPGGHGGIGGPGGRGGLGAPGAPATRYTPGSNGGDGGDGGDGGFGSHGAPGGSGGVVQIKMNEQDAYLIMSVDQARNPDFLVTGGAGGAPGRHGSGGPGGSGGLGGSPHFWTTTRYEYYTDSNGNRNSHPVTESHSMPGGMPGLSGRRGMTPITPLAGGGQGAPGTFQMVICSAVNGQEMAFESRYHLEANDFQIKEFGHLNTNSGETLPDGVFEFGQCCYIDGISVKNVGGMPTPSMQRQMIRLMPGRWVNPGGDETGTQDAVYTIRGMAIDQNTAVAVDGQLRYQIGMIELGALDNVDFDPPVLKESVKLNALQLGIETEGYHGPNTKYQKEFDNFQDGDIQVMKVQFPAQNIQGFLGLNSLAAGESTVVQFPIKNISTLPMGHMLGGRNVGVRVFMAGGTSLNTDNIEFAFAGYKLPKVTDQNGNLIENPKEKENVYNPDFFGAQARGVTKSGEILLDLSPGATQGQPHVSGGMDPTPIESGVFFAVPMLPESSLSTLKMRVRLNKNVPAYAYGELRAFLYLEDLYAKQWRLIQKRMMDIRCEPTFMPSEYTQAILVTSSSTTQGEFDAWMNLLASEFGLITSVYSVSRYGAFSPAETVLLEDHDAAAAMNNQMNTGQEGHLQEQQLIEKRIADFLPGTLVVVLDREFQVDRGVNAAPSELALQGWATRCYRGNAKKKLGGASSQAIQVSGPSYLIVSDKPNQKAFQDRPSLTGVKHKVCSSLGSMDAAKRCRTYPSVEAYKESQRGIFRRGDTVRLGNRGGQPAFGIVQRFLRLQGGAASYGATSGGGKKLAQNNTAIGGEAVYLVADIDPNTANPRSGPMNVVADAYGNQGQQMQNKANTNEGKLMEIPASQMQHYSFPSVSAHWTDESLDPMAEYEAIQVEMKQSCCAGNAQPSFHERNSALLKKAKELEDYLYDTWSNLSYTIVAVDAAVVNAGPTRDLRYDPHTHRPQLQEAGSACCGTNWFIGELRVFSMRKPLDGKLMRPRVYHMVPDSGNAAIGGAEHRQVEQQRQKRQGWDKMSMQYGVAKALEPALQLFIMAQKPHMAVVLLEAIVSNFAQEMFECVDSTEEKTRDETLRCMPTLKQVLGLKTFLNIAAATSAAQQADGTNHGGVTSRMSSNAGPPTMDPQLRKLVADMVSQMVALTRAPGCHRWWQCCSKFRVRAKVIRQILEDEVCKALGIRVDKAVVERTHKQIKECLGDKGTSRAGVLGRYSARGFVRYVVPSQGKMAQQQLKANVSLVQELYDQVQADKELPQHVVPGQVYENICIHAAKAVQIAHSKRERVRQKRALYASNSGSSDQMDHGSAPVWENFEPQFVENLAMPAMAFEQQAFNHGGFQPPTAPLAAPSGWDHQAAESSGTQQ
ncbi:unnamed protein product [Amoebophrya sp. A25]|nr:unnamed protein product [Amoebophrya sp. A25]|eukprot:GSA25T00025438001.1